MTAEVVFPDHLLTLEEFTELPWDNSRRYELQEGVLIVSPRATWLRQRVLPGRSERQPLSLAAYHLAGEFGYQEAPAVTRVLKTNEPFPLRIDLTELPDGPARQHGEGNR